VVPSHQGVLPEHPYGLPVRIEFADLGLEAAIRTLPVQVEPHGQASRLVEPRLLEFHHLVGAVPDVENVVEPLPAVDIPVVVGDELAHVGGEERLVGLRARDLDVGGALQYQILPEPPRATQPDGRVLIIIGRHIRDRSEGVPSYPHGRLPAGQAPAPLEGPWRRRVGWRRSGGRYAVRPFAGWGRAHLSVSDGRLARSVRRGHLDPAQEVLALGRPREGGSPVGHIGQRSRPVGDGEANGAVGLRDEEDRQPAIHRPLAVGPTQWSPLGAEADLDGRPIREEHLVLRRDAAAVLVVLEADHVPVVREVVEGEGLRSRLIGLPGESGDRSEEEGEEQGKDHIHGETPIMIMANALPPFPAGPTLPFLWEDVAGPAVNRLQDHPEGT